jgi:1,4-alpha-glucan branching enzyme
MSVYIPHTIRVRILNARHVAVVGDFNNWHTSAHPLVEVAPGSWERIIDLPAGKHRYAFFVLEETTTETSETLGLRSRVVANGSVIWVSDIPEQAVSITAHPSLAIHQHSPSIAEAA